MNCNRTPPAGPRSSTPGGGAISQALLREFVALAVQVRQLRALRAQLIELLEAGTPVAPGPLTAKVSRWTSRRLTTRKLSDLIGADLVAEFLEHIEPTEARRLLVREV